MKKIFWNVDTQYDFMRKDGKLYVANAEVIEPKLAQLTNYARERKIQVINTADWHKPDSKELSRTPDFMTTFPEHCMQNTAGARYIPATKPTAPYTIDWEAEGFDAKKVKETREVTLYKDAFDIFAGNKYAAKVVNILKPELAVVYGVATNVCVNYAVQGLLERKVKVVVPLDAIKELPTLPLEETLNAWTQKGAILTTVDDIIRKLG